MRRDEVLRILRENRAALKEHGVSSLSLFGSTARDEAGGESDIDILVEFEQPATFDLYVDLLHFLEALLGCPVDLLTKQGVREQLRPYINAEAIRVA